MKRRRRQVARSLLAAIQIQLETITPRGEWGCSPVKAAGCVPVKAELVPNGINPRSCEGQRSTQACCCCTQRIVGNGSDGHKRVCSRVVHEGALRVEVVLHG